MFIATEPPLRAASVAIRPTLPRRLRQQRQRFVRLVREGADGEAAFDDKPYGAHDKGRESDQSADKRHDDGNVGRRSAGRLGDHCTQNGHQGRHGKGRGRQIEVRQSARDEPHAPRGDRKFRAARLRQCLDIARKLPRAVDRTGEAV